MVKRYLALVSLDEARRRIAAAFPFVPRRERIPVEKASGRVTAAPLFAGYSVPEIHLAAMDGIAVRSSSTHGASEQQPKTIPDAVRVNTGNVVPPGYDAVVMIEDVWQENGVYIVRKPVSPWQHVRPVGEDIGESEMILPTRHRIRPFELGALSAFGITELEVIAVSAGLIPTGSELVPRGNRPKPGQVVESNILMAASQLAELGVDTEQYPITPDEKALIRDAIAKAAAEHDIVIVSAGSSAGTKDYTAEVIAELGEVLIHGVAIKPGKPVIVGRIGERPVIGLPGYPLSALTVLREIVTPLVGAYGLPVPRTEHLMARLASTITSDIGVEEFVLATAGLVNGRYVAVPQSRGAGVQMSAVRANACIRVPADLEGYEAGAEVPIALMAPRERIDSALVVTGSHDPALDYLADLVQQRGVELHSTHVGSMGGLLALKRRECHAAPMHLLGEDGEYNIPYLTKYLPGEDLVLVRVADREQGIISRTGLGFEELPGHTFVNRQRGSGTRQLLDHLLKQRGIDPASIRGYDREVTTHLAVALAVKTGEVDAGMGVAAAAKTLGLAFAPVGVERYEIALYRSSLDDWRIAALLDTIRSEPFRDTLLRLGGYGTSETGCMREVPHSPPPRESRRA